MPSVNREGAPWAVGLLLPGEESAPRSESTCNDLDRGTDSFQGVIFYILKIEHYF